MAAHELKPLLRECVEAFPAELRLRLTESLPQAGLGQGAFGFFFRPVALPVGLAVAPVANDP